MPTNPKQQARFDPQRGSSPPEMIDLVEASWILKALGGVLAVALLCAFTTLCVLFSRSQWQLVLHPRRAVATMPSALGLNFTEVHFGVDASGQPQLDGWFIPANDPRDTTAGNPATGPTAPTALLLHNGDDSISDALPIARTLHDAHLNVLLFDYRGYGHSSGQHPTEASMEADAETALAYLTTTRSIPASSIVVYGNGVGGALAVRLCAEHHALPALILQSPDGDFEARVRQDPRSRLVPVSLLFDQNFPLARPLHTLTTPKLLISTTNGPAPVEFQRAAYPRTTVELQPNDTTALHQALTHFLSAHLQPIPGLKSTH
jgi:pimeloyl-ACP methyl ester carboxylesterase